MYVCVEVDVFVGVSLCKYTTADLKALGQSAALLSGDGLKDFKRYTKTLKPGGRRKHFNKGGGG